MRRLSNGLFLACVLCLGAAGFGACRDPGLVTRLTQKGVDYAAEVVVRELKKLAKGGIPLGDHNGSYDGYFGEAQYSLTDTVITKLEGVRLGATIDEDIGLKVSLRIAELQLRGSLYYSCSVLRIPISSNRLALNLTLSSISINFTATLEVGSRGQLAANATRCDASISPVGSKLDFGPNGAWIANLLGGSDGSTMARLLSETVCTKIENTRMVLINDTKRFLSMCILGTCTLMLVLPFVAQPVFGKGYVETAHAVEMHGHDGARIRSPFVPRPFRRLWERRRMLTVYLSPHVANSMLYALFRSGKLAFKVTDKDLLANLLQNDVDSCRGGFCLARFLARHLSNSRLEVEFSATSCPKFEVSANITTLTIQSDLAIKTIRDNSTTSTLAKFPINAFITGKAYIVNNRLCFNIMDDAAKQSGRQDSTSVKDGIWQILVKIFESKLLSKFSELGKAGIPLPEYANIRWKNPSLTSVDDAYVLTTDVIYSPNPQTK